MMYAKATAGNPKKLQYMIKTYYVPTVEMVSEKVKDKTVTMYKYTCCQFTKKKGK